MKQLITLENNFKKYYKLVMLLFIHIQKLHLMISWHLLDMWPFVLALMIRDTVMDLCIPMAVIIILLISQGHLKLMEQ